LEVSGICHILQDELEQEVKEEDLNQVAATGGCTNVSCIFYWNRYKMYQMGETQLLLMVIHQHLSECLKVNDNNESIVGDLDTVFSLTLISFARAV
jgi:hypothetical protein